VKKVPKSLVIVYTGHGKGKTTAALGLLFRALGRGWKAAVVQFVKGAWRTGEQAFAKKAGLDYFMLGRGFTWESEDLSLDAGAARAAWNKARELLLDGRYDVVVLDEITYAFHFKWLEVEDVLKTLKKRAAKTSVVLTGRDAPSELTDFADLVTEMRPVKHPYDKGIPARAGIDF
jgi:cob(I)alamin adenosyltransferase